MTVALRPLLLSLFLIGCRDKDAVPEDTGTPDTDTTAAATPDADADGYDESEDCDDNNSLVNPGAEEICDGADNNCDGQVDEGVTTTFYDDADGDGFGDSYDTTEACEIPDGYVATGNDCDDTDGEVYPGAPEQCDEIDNDCDDEIDEDVRYDWYADADGDGYGDADSAYKTCDPPPGYTDDDSDCDDTNAAAYPGAEEVCDEADNDCDDAVDEGVTTTYYQDTDGDGFGISETTTEACDVPTGYAADAGDCDDSDGAISPNATEVCDDVDNDCDGDTDATAIDQSTFYADSDSDGFGDASSTATGCDSPSGYTSDATDCDDTDSAINPDAVEVCDGADNDCDGDIDTDATDMSTYYADNDGDGYGGSSSTTACDEPTGYADNSDDCDDGEAAANPGATESCDDIDNDCDGSVDEGLLTTYYRDADSDGYGSPDTSVEECAAPSGYTATAEDCDDTDSSANPGETESCDEVDNDCDGSVDEGVTTTYYLDADSDGYGDPSRSTEDCAAPSLYVADDTDCDDLDADSNPDAEEVCDGADNDCDGSSDNGVMGSSAECAAESCADVLLDDASAADGDYYLDPTGSGTAELYACDMTTDGGGWTQVITWNREDDGDSLADFEALMTENYNTMGTWSEATNYIYWNDAGSNSKAMDYELDIEIPNDGEVNFTVDYYGYSMEDSSIWFYVTTDSGSEENLQCWELNSGSASNYSSTEQSYLPNYSCSDSASGNISVDATTQSDFGDEVVSYHITSLHYDNGTGDYSYLYDFEVWVR